MSKTKSFLFVCMVVLLCSSMSVFGLTTIKVKNKTTYSKDMKGSIGYYQGYTNSTGTYVYTSATNRTSQSFYYSVSVAEYSYENNKSISSRKAATLGVGKMLKTNGVARDKTSGAVTYYHRAYGYASSSSASGKIDSFELDADQYYR